MAMAAEIRPVDEQTTPSKRKESLSQNELFVPKDTLDQPCDVVLVVEDGKEFKAHRNVLLKASPFFEKLLNSDMKESKEGVVRLEMFGESVMAATLEFIYTGHVQILAEDNARDLIVMADYLFLQKLKSLVEGIIAQKLNTFNCISTYYFSERYQCEELLSKTKKFILVNFSAVYAANREVVLNMSSKEVEMCISSDEIDVSAEEDVFKFMLAWIDHDITERKKYFAELFRQVRLVYISRDFLNSDVVTNDLVKDNEGCLDLVKDALDSIDSKNCDNLSVPARKSLETPAIVIHTWAELLCYLPREDSWCRLGQIPTYYTFLPCGGKLYGVEQGRYLSDMISYNPYTKSWTRLPRLEEDTLLWKLFATNGEEMFALLCNVSCPCRDAVYPTMHVSEHNLFISKYKPESHSWEDIFFLDHFKLNERWYFCIVPSDHFIYFIGGLDMFGHLMSDVDRYDLSKGQWDKVADIQVARRMAHGAAVKGKIFIVSGFQLSWEPLLTCEMYHEKTNEWQFIASLKKLDLLKFNLVANDGKIYAVRSQNSGMKPDQCSIECYNPENNKWEMKSGAVLPRISRSMINLSAFSMRIFKGFFHIRPLENSNLDSFLPKNSTSDSLSEASTTQNHNWKCVVM
ncbi:kelch-like protein 28 [Oculina patagonica]